MRLEVLSACAVCCMAAHAHDAPSYSGYDTILTQRLFQQDISPIGPSEQKHSQHNETGSHFVYSSPILDMRQQPLHSVHSASPSISSKHEEAKDEISKSAEKICASRVLRPGLSLTGATDTLLKNHFSQVFPWKVAQLRLAIRYNNKINRLAADFWSADGKSYNKATEELHKLHSISRALDATLIEQDSRVPRMIPYTEPLNAPHLRMGEPGYSVQELARDEARNMLATAATLGFTVQAQQVAK